MLKKIRVLFTESRHVVKDKAPNALTAFEQLLRLADKASIPLVGGAFSAAAEIMVIYKVCTRISPRHVLV